MSAEPSTKKEPPHGTRGTQNPHGGGRPRGRFGCHDPTGTQASPPGAKDVTAVLFEWNFASVAKECTSTLGPAGYGYVQVSPPAEHIQGGRWWTSYQPVSYRIAGRFGDQGFAVLNHESGPLEGTGRTSRPAGTYCDVQSGGTVDVNGSGQFTATPGAHTAPVLYAAGPAAEWCRPRRDRRGRHPGTLPARAPGPRRPRPGVAAASPGGPARLG